VRASTGSFSADPATLAPFNPSLDWSGRLTVDVGDAVVAGDNAVACISEGSPNGSHYNIARVAAGPDTGDYYNTGGDCSDLTPATLSGAWSTGWQ